MQLAVGAVTVDLKRKKIRNIHLTVHPPDGHLTVSAPVRTGLAEIRAFVASRTAWIELQQRRMRAQSALYRRDAVDGEFCEVWGRRRRLSVQEGVEPFGAALIASRLVLRVPRGADRVQRMRLLEDWYAAETLREAMNLVNKWQRLMGVRVACLTVRPMKTRWGSCSVKSRAIRINSELARRLPVYLEYIVVHELAHLRVPAHDARFESVMDRYVPEWKSHRRELNRLPPCLSF